MKKLIPVLAALALALTIFLFAANPGDPDGARVLAGDSADARGTLEVPVFRRLEEEPGARLAARHHEFRAGGDLVVHSAGTRPVRLRWDSAIEISLAEAARTEGEWSAILPVGVHRLEQAWLGGLECVVLNDVRVSPESPNASIELLGPGECLLELLDASNGASLQSASIMPDNDTLLPSPSGPVRVTRSLSWGGRADRLLDGATLDESSPLTIRYSGSRIVLPEWAQRQSVRIVAAGYRDRVLAPFESPGAHAVEMSPVTELLVGLSNPPESGARYDVTVHLADGTLLHRFASVRAPRELELTTPDSATEVLVRVSRSPTIGIGPVGFERLVSLRRGAVSRVSIDLDDVRADGPSSSLRLTVLAQAQCEGMARWSARLVPVEPTGTPTLPGDFLRSRLSAWECIAPGREYLGKFEGLQPGVYDLVISPIGYSRQIDISEARLYSERVEVPTLTDLLVWPVDSAGVQIMDAGQLGMLAWHPVDADQASPAAELDSSSLMDPFADDGAFIDDLERGHLHFASGTADGAWLIRASAGREIVVEFVGPEALGALPLRIELVPGPMEATLTFSKL